MSTTTIVLQDFEVICVLLVFENAGVWQKIVVFGKDVFNMHGFKCTHRNIKIFFLKIMITFLRHALIWNAKRLTMT